MTYQSKKKVKKPPKVARQAVGIDDIRPDGVLVRVHWEKLEVGSSFFIPCLNTKKAMDELRRIAKRKEMKLTFKEIIENGCYGLRVWRKG